ncbi:hypothetical protein SAMN05444266_105145 [Chitinophaga jiangningensis]|uniref:YD repeat-containing protein n=1 Tax=Chitinophaga jiangningensis TaxID=1419482 RepID=A0A1M7DUG2_9BACT|nr:hypothetical protein [Chitinophaga jiangningensis]SHL83135.1 hypothetical protein SAMN05444266_105145 [Chitinophaga jiangningensis]
MNKKSLLVTGTMFSLLALSLFSCKKSDDATPDPEPPLVVESRPLLDSVVTIAADPIGNEATAFRYNTDSTQAADIYIGSEGNQSGNFFLYINKQMTRYVFSPTANIKDSTDGYACSYDTKGRLVIINPDNWANRDSFVYNDANQLIRKYKFYAGDIQNSDTLTWTGKNLTKYTAATRYYGGTENDVYLETYTFKYDEKKNPYLCVPASTLFYAQDKSRLSENNVVEMNYEVRNGPTRNTKYTYTYNDKNYPTSATYVKTGEGVADNGTIRFVYKK